MLHAFFVCSSYLIVGLALILLNQYILKDLYFPYPMFLSGLGVLASAIVARLMVRFGHAKISRPEEVAGILWYQRVLPVGMASAATLAFGNMVYLLLDVGFIQMLKSFTPVVIITFGYLTGVDIPTMPVVYSVIVISVGIAATCTFSPQFNILGITVMMLSAVTEAMRLVLTQFLLKQMKFGIVEGQYVLAPASAVCLFLASAVFEAPRMYEKNAFLIIFDNFSLFLLASLMGVIVNFMAYGVIQLTSSLMMKMLGTLRSIVTIFLGIALYGEVVDLREIEGYFVALVGFIGYNLASAGYFANNELLNLPPHKAVEKLWSNIIASSGFTFSSLSSSNGSGGGATEIVPEMGRLLKVDSV